ncbi:IS1595 family transposase [Intestinibacter bartlettii]|uniref:IS1595 family transposase n=1 Tax=Intestinibacter bartlettii TaxID=261299 RepID=A0ABS6DXW7_9FIRM|nr:IS1595 family transposase [Intestinibacter bartlettii]MBU5336682.1 IS1595 family transposase [Intestinibacter bartlettii]MDO5010632.1 IS1595 family transposase [Intestinibacter bartlettii]
MFKTKEPGVFDTTNLEDLTKNLTKNQLESLVYIIQRKIKQAYYSKIDLGSDEEFLGNFPNKCERDIEILRGRFKNGLKCPKCGNHRLNKNGRSNNRQRYICKNCRTTFDERSFSPLSNTKLSLDTWLKYCRFMVEGGTIRYCAQKVSVSIPTSFFMRHRILDVLNLSVRNQVFQGIVSADEYHLNESFKGKSIKKSIEEDRYFYNFEYENMPKGGGFTFRDSNYLLKNPEKYIKPIQVKINTAIDRNGHVLTRIVENPHFKPYSKEKYQDMLSFFTGRLDKNAILCSFKTPLYRDAAYKLNVKFQKARNRMNEPIYTVHHVLMYHNKLSRWLSNFHGVATKYLNNYLSWYSFLFILQKTNKIGKINDLFIEFTTKTLSITQKQIQNRQVELI